MTLTQSDLQAIGTVVSTAIEQQVRPLVKEELSAALTAQNKFVAHSFADLKAVLENTYVSREELEQVKEDLQSEVDDLRQQVQELKHKLTTT